MDSLNFIDIIILIIFAVSGLLGFGRGLVGEVIALGTLIIAIIIAINFSTPLAAYFTSIPSVQNMVNQAATSAGSTASSTANYVALAISYTILFVGTILVGAIFRYILNIVFQTGMLGLGNRFLGGIFGLIRGYLISIVIVFIIQLTPISNQSFWQQSYFVTQFQPQVQWLAGEVSPALANIKNTLNQTLQSVGSQFQNLSAP